MPGVQRLLSLEAAGESVRLAHEVAAGEAVSHPRLCARAGSEHVDGIHPVWMIITLQRCRCQSWSVVLEQFWRRSTQGRCNTERLRDAATRIGDSGVDSGLIGAMASTFMGSAVTLVQADRLRSRCVDKSPRHFVRGRLWVSAKTQVSVSRAACIGARLRPLAKS